MNDTTVLTSVVGASTAKPAQSFFPLTVNYQEKAYAAGKIPGSFFRREGRPSEQEILTSRLIDRSIRPLFPDGFMNEVQVVCTLLSADLETPPDIPALLGTVAALALSELPFHWPLVAARVGFTDDYILNPGYSELKESTLDMVVSGNRDAVLMVESEAAELSEQRMLGGILFAQKEMQAPIDAIEDLVKEAGKPKQKHEQLHENQELLAEIEKTYAAQIEECVQTHDKGQRGKCLASLKSKLIEAMPQHKPEALSAVLNSAYKKQMRNSILDKQIRPDGRNTTTVRPITIEAPVLAKTHGSSLFTRGETQALVTATLGSLKDAALIDAVTGNYYERFLLHYNFPPYSVGETGMMTGPKRREIGHGNLARRALARMLPTEEDFPYTVRVVSEITESNGSSSMATVCGASLSLMDAGVPIKASVAGVAMGLILEEDGRFSVLTDIIGDEDHLGDMDFKVAGTRKGVTALQMDIKVTGVSGEIMETALKQAFDARMHILEAMDAVLAEPRKQVSGNAPAFETIQIPVDKIRELIGKRGATIREITDETGASIDIDKDGSVKIYASARTSLDEAIAKIKAITSEPEPGTVYKGTVKSVVDFGAFVEIMPGKQGLLHVSEITGEHIEDVSDYLTEDQEVEVVVLSVDNQNRIKLSMKDVHQAEKISAEAPAGSQNESGGQTAEKVAIPAVGDAFEGTVKHVEHYGGFVEITPGLRGLVHKSEISSDEWVESALDYLEVGEKVDVVVVDVEEKDNKTRVSLSIKRAQEGWEDSEDD